MPAAAIYQVLPRPFYARRHTLSPTLTQGGAIGSSLLVALQLLWLTELGFLALVLGNSAQWIGHALITYALLSRAVHLGGLRLGEAALKGLLASALMAAVVLGVAVLGAALPPLLLVALAGAAGAAIYVGLATALRIEALSYFVRAVRERLGR